MTSHAQYQTLYRFAAGLIVAIVLGGLLAPVALYYLDPYRTTVIWVTTEETVTENRTENYTENETREVVENITKNKTVTKMVTKIRNLTKLVKKNRTVNTTTTRTFVGTRPLDAYMVLDSSNSVKQIHWKPQLAFAGMMALKLAANAPKLRLGMGQFAGGFKEEHPLHRIGEKQKEMFTYYSKIVDTKESYDKLRTKKAPELGGRTRVYAGLCGTHAGDMSDSCEDGAFGKLKSAVPPPGSFACVNKDGTTSDSVVRLIILITDGGIGNSTEAALALQKAKVVKDNGVQLLGIFVGDGSIFGNEKNRVAAHSLYSLTSCCNTSDMPGAEDIEMTEYNDAAVKCKTKFDSKCPHMVLTPSFDALSKSADALAQSLTQELTCEMTVAETKEVLEERMEEETYNETFNESVTVQEPVIVSRVVQTVVSHVVQKTVFQNVTKPVSKAETHLEYKWEHLWFLALLVPLGVRVIVQHALLFLSSARTVTRSEAEVELSSDARWDTPFDIGWDPVEDAMRRMGPGQVRTSRSSAADMGDAEAGAVPEIVEDVEEPRPLPALKKWAPVTTAYLIGGTRMDVTYGSAAPPSAPAASRRGKDRRISGKADTPEAFHAAEVAASEGRAIIAQAARVAANAKSYADSAAKASKAAEDSAVGTAWLARGTPACATHATRAAHLSRTAHGHAMDAADAAEEAQARANETKEDKVDVATRQAALDLAQSASVQAEMALREAERTAAEASEVRSEAEMEAANAAADEFVPLAVATDMIDPNLRKYNCGIMSTFLATVLMLPVVAYGSGSLEVVMQYLQQ